MDPRIQEVLDSINHDLSRSRSLEEMADSVDLSASHFAHLFKLATSQSPGRYVRTVRIEKARERLETTRQKVKEICRTVGIGDGSHFVRDFGKLYGLSPSEYRKRHFAKGRGPGKRDSVSQ